jgi:hypothetical protein
VYVWVLAALLVMASAGGGEEVKREA